MVREGEILAKIAKNVCIKLPMTLDGLKARKYFSDKGIQTNVTLCFSASQAILAAKAGATFVSPFVGRLDDIGQDGMNLIEEICDIYANYPNFKTGSFGRFNQKSNSHHSRRQNGRRRCYNSAKVFKTINFSSFNRQRFRNFCKDWASTGQKI